MPENVAIEQARSVAVIDIGSNSIRMVIAQVKPDGSFETLERVQRPVRLGHSTFVTGRLSEQTMDAAIAVLRDYRRLCENYNIVTLRAVATSAVREATNNDAFLDRAGISADIDVEIIEPAEESRLTVSAVKEEIDGCLNIKDGPAVVVEVGGGSALVTILKEGRIAVSEGYNLGSIRLQEILGTADMPPDRAADIFRRHIASVVTAMQRTMPIRGAKHFIAVGGDARLAAQSAGKVVAEPNIFELPVEALEGFVKKCSRLTPQELARAHGVPFANAETLTPALIAYLALLKASRCPKMLVAHVSMRDGLLLDLARALGGKEDPELVASTVQAAQSIGEKYQYDARHAQHVAEMSLKLFDALKAAHRLSVRDRLLLHVAALLHEVGGFVSSRAHHKHSYYLISNSVIVGLRRDELDMVALMARYHRRSGPKSSHPEYMALPRGQRMVVNKLAALLRVADALDRAHEERVKEFTAEVRGTELLITVPAVEMMLEQRALDRKADLLEEAYGLKARIVEAGPAPTAPSAEPA